MQFDRFHFEYYKKLDATFSKTVFHVKKHSGEAVKTGQYMFTP